MVDVLRVLINEFTQAKFLRRIINRLQGRKWTELRGTMYGKGGVGGGYVLSKTFNSFQITCFCSRLASAYFALLSDKVTVRRIVVFFFVIAEDLPRELGYVSCAYLFHS